jgi:hypothetical protein
MLTVLACLGCSNSDFPTAKATGIVVCEGEPVANVAVRFSPMRAGDSAISGARAWAQTDENGKFVLSTYDSTKEDGAIIGKHEVYVWATPETSNSTPAALSISEKVTEVEVVKGKKNDFTIELRKRAPREQLVIPTNDD